MSEQYLKKYLKYKQKYFNEVYGGMATPLDTAGMATLLAKYQSDLKILQDDIITTLIPKLEMICKNKFQLASDADSTNYSWDDKTNLNPLIPFKVEIFTKLEISEEKISSNNSVEQLFKIYDKYITFIFKTLPNLLKEAENDKNMEQKKEYFKKYNSLIKTINEKLKKEIDDKIDELI